MARVSFTYTAGVLIRGAIRREITSSAWAHGIDVTFEEEKGWLDSALRVRATHENEILLDSWARGVQSYLRRCAADA